MAASAQRFPFKTDLFARDHSKQTSFFHWPLAPKHQHPTPTQINITYHCGATLHTITVFEQNLVCAHSQEGNEVRWRPGHEARLAPPVFEPEVFWMLMRELHCISNEQLKCCSMFLKNWNIHELHNKPISCSDFSCFYSISRSCRDAHHGAPLLTTYTINESSFFTTETQNDQNHASSSRLFHFFIYPILLCTSTARRSAFFNRTMIACFQLLVSARNAKPFDGKAYIHGDHTIVALVSTATLRERNAFGTEGTHL